MRKVLVAIDGNNGIVKFVLPEPEVSGTSGTEDEGQWEVKLALINRENPILKTKIGPGGRPYVEDNWVWYDQTQQKNLIPIWESELKKAHRTIMRKEHTPIPPELKATVSKVGQKILEGMLQSWIGLKPVKVGPEELINPLSLQMCLNNQEQGNETISNPLLLNQNDE